MQDITITFNIIVGILTVLFLGALLIVRNLLLKLEKYEDAVLIQTQRLQNISNTILESKQHLQNLDEKGVFQSDDEVGEFFNQMQQVQNELNAYIIDIDDAEKEKQS